MCASALSAMTFGAWPPEIKTDVQRRWRRSPARPATASRARREAPQRACRWRSRRAPDRRSAPSGPWRAVRRAVRPSMARARRLSVGSPLIRNFDPFGDMLASISSGRIALLADDKQQPTFTLASRSRSAAATCAAMIPFASQVAAAVEKLIVLGAPKNGGTVSMWVERTTSGVMPGSAA